MVEDVLVKVDKFIFPVEFVMLDMEEDHDVSLILGRPFLDISRALIDVQSSELTLQINEEEVNSNIYRSIRFPNETTTCYQLDSITDCVVKTQMGSNTEDPLERCLTLPRMDNSKLTNEEIMHDLYAQDAQHKVTTLLHVKEEWV